MNSMPPITLDPAMWFEQALKVLALRLRHEVAMMRVLRGPDRQEGFLGLFLSDQEVQAMLGELAGLLQVDGAAPLEAEIDAMQANLAKVRRADPNYIWSRMAQSFHLAEPELELILLCAAPAIDPRFGRVYGYLNDDMSRRFMTPVLAKRLLRHQNVDMINIRDMLSQTAPLIKNMLINIELARPFIESALRIDEALLDQLIAPHNLRMNEFDYADIIHSKIQSDKPRFPITLALSYNGADAGIIAMQQASTRKVPLMCIDYARLNTLSQELVSRTVNKYLRDARLKSYLPYIRGFELAPETLCRAVAARAQSPIVLEAPNVKFWAQYGIEGELIAPQVDTVDRKDIITAHLKSHIAATPSIKQLLMAARSLSVIDIAKLLKNCATETGLKAAVEGQMSKAMKGIATPIISSFTLDDIMVPQQTQYGIDSLISWHIHSDEVLNEWGLGKVFNKKAGATALFKGPSGTGKTMAASIIANVLKLPIVRVDLAGMISKYIGETEKNLDKLFKAAEKSDVIIFFDEADAIFGQRSEVNDSHDRYANIETSYLLQRMEVFKGTSILATNLHQNMDDAFLRRIDFVIEFPTPGYEERRKIWQQIKSANAPIGSDVCFDTLAQNFDLTGGEIRNCILDAAHQASRRSACISMEDFMQAVSRELTKQNKPVRKHSFGSFYAGLKTLETS